ncbi:MAG: hypothetical protein JWN78_1195 [Bacteroidota bacterium]|nr:hypothetical protein [Bacteroidota bacterium]
MSVMKSKKEYTKVEAEEIISMIQEKLKSDAVKQKGIRAKIRSRGFWASEFGFRDGYTVQDFLSVIKVGDNKLPISTPFKNKAVKVSVEKRTANFSRMQSDECYILDLCDEVLKQKAIRQHRFDFLKGDTGVRLPVDAYYPPLNLVIEYREKQHTEEVKFFDKRITVSGMTRGEQRKRYDQIRRDILPQYGIKLIELGYDDFEYSRSKKLIRNETNDIARIAKVLKGNKSIGK